MSQHVAIVGATGFLGRALTRHFSLRGVNVHGFSSTKTRADDDTPLTQFDAAHDEICFPEETKAVFYLAQSPFYREFPSRAEHLMAVNVLGAVKAARAAVEAGVSFFFYASTGNVYHPSLQPLREDHPVRRDNGYALSKVMAEESLALVSAPMQLVVGRIFGLFGPGQSGMLVPNICNRIRQGQPVQFVPSTQEPADTDGLRVSLCYVDDACRCLSGLVDLHSDGVALPSTINLAGAEPISIRRLAGECGRIIGTSAVIEQGDGTRTFDLVSDNSRLRKLIAPEFTPFSTALEQTLRSEGAAPDRSRDWSKAG